MKKLVSFHIQAHLNAFLQILDYFSQICLGPLARKSPCTRYHIGAPGRALGCDTALQVTGSIPDGVIGILHWHNPSDRTMVLGSNQSLTEMSTRDISRRVKAAGV